jgi:hypothetical protein
MDPQSLLQQLLTFERRVRDIYRTFSRYAGFTEPVRLFWSTMAEDETHHVVSLERSAHLFSVLDSSPAVIETEIARVEETISAAEIATQQPTVTLNEALQIGLLIEGSELNHLDEAWVQGFRSTCRLLLQSLTPSHAAHVRRLVDAVHEFSSDNELRVKAEALWKTYEHQRVEPTPPTSS